LREHLLVFHFPGQQVLSGLPQKLHFPYDRNAIVEIGYNTHQAIPINQDMAELITFGCALEDDEETEPTEKKIEKEEKPGMSEEIKRLDEEISPIEKWQ
jgi:hypothetical protein